MLYLNLQLTLMQECLIIHVPSLRHKPQGLKLIYGNLWQKEVRSVGLVLLIAFGREARNSQN